MPDKSFPVRRKIGPERRHDGSEHAANAFACDESIDCGIVGHFLILLHHPNFWNGIYAAEWVRGLNHERQSTCE
jgi:hypothetical protein